MSLVNFQATKVRLLDAATVAALETAVNAFLSGAGTPVSNDKWRLVSFDVRIGGLGFIGVVTYTGD